MEFKVEKDIPLPLRKPKKLYPFDKLEIGNSSFVTGGNQRNISALIAYYVSKYPDKTFTTSKRDEDGVTGVRCWRVK